MSAQRAEPKRWTELDSEAPAELRSLLTNAARDLPSTAELASLARRLPPELGVAPPPGSDVAAAASRLPQLGKLALVLVGVGAIGLATLKLRQESPEAPRMEGGKSTPASGIPDAPIQPAPGAAPEPSAAQAQTAATPAVQPSQEEAANTPPRAPRSAPPAPRLGEAELLERARRALAKDPQLALSYTRQHQARFPNGVLRQEREVIAIEALRRVGRESDAARKAGEFEKAFPDSAHRRAIESGRGK